MKNLDPRCRMTANNESWSWKFFLLNVLVLGTLLGLIEAALGGGMRRAGLPLRGPLVTAVGFAIMGVGLAVFRRKRVLPGIMAMGIFSRFLAVPLLGLPLFCRANSHLAMLLNGLFLFAAVGLFRDQDGSGWRPRALLGATAAFSSGTAFFALGRFVAPCRHLLSFNYAGGAAAYLATRIVPAALLAGLLFPLGYALGGRLEKTIMPLWLARKPLLLPLAAVFAASCLGLTVILSANGY
jgi:hypothetical protein